MRTLTLHEHLARNFASKSDAFLTIALLAAAGFLIWMAFQPDHQLVKAAVLAWVVLP